MWDSIRQCRAGRLDIVIALRVRSPGLLELKQSGQRLRLAVWDVADLDDEVAHHPPVVGVHAWAEGVENARHTNIHIGLSVVGVPEEQMSRAAQSVITL